MPLPPHEYPSEPRTAPPSGGSFGKAFGQGAGLAMGILTGCCLFPVAALFLLALFGSLTGSSQREAPPGKVPGALPPVVRTLGVIGTQNPNVAYVGDCQALRAMVQAVRETPTAQQFQVDWSAQFPSGNVYPKRITYDRAAGVVEFWNSAEAVYRYRGVQPAHLETLMVWSATEDVAVEALTRLGIREEFDRP